MSDGGIADVVLRENTSQRLPCVSVPAASRTMGGAPRDEVNAGLTVLESELKKDDIASQRVQLLVIRCGGDVEVISDWQDAENFQAPRITASGGTPLGESVRLALSKIEEQKARYKANGIPYNRPWLFVITDGEPNDDGWEQAADAARAADIAEKLVFFGIATAGANLATLRRFAPENRPPVMLQGLKFRELFLWLSQSTRSGSKAAQGTNAQMPSPADWMQVPT